MFLRKKASSPPSLILTRLAVLLCKLSSRGSQPAPTPEQARPKNMRAICSHTSMLPTVDHVCVCVLKVGRPMSPPNLAHSYARDATPVYFSRWPSWGGGRSLITTIWLAARKIRYRSTQTEATNSQHTPCVHVGSLRILLLRAFVNGVAAGATLSSPLALAYCQFA